MTIRTWQKRVFIRLPYGICEFLPFSLHKCSRYPEFCTYVHVLACFRSSGIEPYTNQPEFDFTYSGTRGILDIVVPCTLKTELTKALARVYRRYTTTTDRQAQVAGQFLVAQGVAKHSFGL